MSRADDERIDDIAEAGAEIAAIVADGREAWETDRVRQLAVERLLEIIGESARAMTDRSRTQYPEIPWSDVIGLRTVLAHHYHRASRRRPCWRSGDLVGSSGADDADGFQVPLGEQVMPLDAADRGDAGV